MFTESYLGFVTAAMGDLDDARMHHRAALDAAVDAHDPACLALALEGLATVTPDPRAATLLGGADGLRRAAALDVADASHRDDVAAVATHARTELGAVEFAAAYERGLAMSAGDLVSLARSGDG